MGEWESTIQHKISVPYRKVLGNVDSVNDSEGSSTGYLQIGVLYSFLLLLGVIFGFGFGFF